MVKTDFITFPESVFFFDNNELQFILDHDGLYISNYFMKRYEYWFSDRYNHIRHNPIVERILEIINMPYYTPSHGLLESQVEGIEHYFKYRNNDDSGSS